ncbi:hypothetical protein ADK76_13680, partial [Streptomyces griseoflavus]
MPRRDCEVPRLTVGPVGSTGMAMVYFVSFGWTSSAADTERFQWCLSRVRTALAMTLMRLGLQRVRRKMRQ